MTTQEEGENQQNQSINVVTESLFKENNEEDIIKNKKIKSFLSDQIQLKNSIVKEEKESMENNKISKDTKDQKKESKSIEDKRKINEVSTIATSNVFLNKSEIMGEKDPYVNLNKSLPNIKTQPTIMELSEGDRGQNKDQQKQNVGFFGRTKNWAGNVWRTMTNFNFGRLWQRPEFEECYDASGNIIKIPKKKLPLKKQSPKQTEEERRIQYTLKKEQNYLETAAFDGTTYGSFFI